MANTLKKIGEGEYRFDCDCGRLHLISADGDEGKIKIETIYTPPKGKASASDLPEKDPTKKDPAEKKSIFDGIL